MILASCGSNTNSNQNTQAAMDSISKANAALQDEINKKKNDSTINAIATAKADSIEKESHRGTTHEGEHREHRRDGDNQQNQPPVTQAPPPTVSPVNNRPGANGPKSVNDRPGAH